MEGAVLPKRKKMDVYGITPTSLCKDLVIEDFMAVLRNGGGKTFGYLRVYSLPTVFFTSIDKGGYHRVDRWTRRAKISDYDVLFFPVHVPATEYSEEDLERESSRRMKEVTADFKEMFLSKTEAMEEAVQVVSPACPPIAEVDLNMEIKVEKEDDTDPFEDVPDMFESECLDALEMGFEVLKSPGVPKEERPPSPALSINAEADLLEAILEATSDEPRDTQRNEVQASCPEVDPMQQDSVDISIPCTADDEPNCSSVSEQKVPNSSVRDRLGVRRRRRKSPQMKRRTMWVTLKDGTRKRVNVRKLGLPVYQPFG